MIKIRLLIALSLGCCLVGCSSTQKLSGSAAPIPSKECNVTVYATQQEAEKKGAIEEACVISGTSSMSFMHTVETAIKKHKGKACKCGADNVYIQSQRPMTFDVATVTMVAFRYVSDDEKIKSVDEDTKQKARKCQEKGGLWLNDVCQIEME